MSNVYYKKVDAGTTVDEVRLMSRQLLEEIVERENVELSEKVPLKVHFGEKGNATFIKSENYEGIIDYLREKGIDTCYMETSVMYGGQRYNKELHVKTAAEHGFNQLPIVIADGEQGEVFVEVEVDLKHFKTCKIGGAFLDYDQLFVVSHFKGHMMAGFGGAIKQLAMGHASKGGKLAMHMGIKPRIVNRKCKKCNLCQTRCNEDAITIGKKSFIDHETCVGCGACVAICPNKAVSIISAKGLYNGLLSGKKFREKLVEYAYAAQKGKKNIYFNFAINVTKGCDCEPKKMSPIMEDFGIFVSTDPVAIDKVCLDMARDRGNVFKGGEQLVYAEKVGLGSTKYRLLLSPATAATGKGR